MKEVKINQEMLDAILYLIGIDKDNDKYFFTTPCEGNYTNDCTNNCCLHTVCSKRQIIVDLLNQK